MTTYQEWASTVPSEITADPLWHMEVYRIALFVGEICWPDVCKLAQDRKMLEVSDQLYRSAGSISANIAEGYSKASKKDQARFYEYSLGSAREARDWYYKSRHVLGNEVVLHRMRLLVSVIRTLLKLIPEFRAKKIAEELAPYEVYTLEGLLSNVPFA
ncbi:MAG: four helix bundle protein [Chloroflexota bacterium]